ncbi:hypothetical protein HMPREF0379_0082 [[Eubacterium] yurii subsp. margaretiae ATCC 43715]|nr:hypothetical protein HMPREF0379_0082 [[Eubacterium] yurii subsp. margaretiae ATCC 43715]
METILWLMKKNMKLILVAFECIFRMEWIFQQKLMIYIRKMKIDGNKKILRFKKILSILTVICFLFNNKSSLFLVVGLISIVLYLFLSFEIIFIFTTVRGFLTGGVIGTLFIALLSYKTFDFITGEKFIIDRNYDEYIFFSIVLIIVWPLLSTFCNSKVATLSNAILAAIVTIIIQLNSFVWTVLIVEGRHFFSEEKVLKLKEYGLTEEQWLTTMTNLLFYPIFTMLVMGALSCAVKSYWINKYNSGLDIENI